MINWSSLTESQILVFALILLRMSSFVVSSAVFGSPTINVSVKMLMSLTISVLIFPLVNTGKLDYDLISTEIILLAARELILGLALGFLTRIFFFAVTMTGDLVSTSIGLSASQLFNPMLGSMGNSIEQLYSTIGTLVFFSINGHHMLLSAITQSYEMLPVGILSLRMGPFAEMAVFGQEIIVLAIKMCAPILVTILIANLSMGILGRAVPQINVLVTSLPVTLMLGLAVIFICLPLLVLEMNSVVQITADRLFSVMKHL